MKVLVKKMKRIIYSLRHTISFRIFLILLINLVIILGLGNNMRIVWAGPLYDNYQELVEGYPQFFNRMIGTGRVTDSQMRSFMKDIDDILSANIINNANFNEKMYNALLNAVMMPKNDAVFDALTSAYGSELSKILSGVLPEDMVGFRDAVKAIVLRYMVTASPGTGTYNVPVTIKLNSFTRDAFFYYTLDGSLPTASNTLYNGSIKIDHSQNLRVIAWKNGISSDPVTFDMKVWGGMLSGKISIEGLSSPDMGRIKFALDGQMLTNVVKADGSFSLIDMLTGLRKISLYYPKHLSVGMQVQLPYGVTTTLNDIILLAGDLNTDGIINLTDLGMMANSYGSRKTMVSYQSGVADINEDGIVDLTDLVLLARNYGQKAS